MKKIILPFLLVIISVLSGFIVNSEFNKKQEEVLYNYNIISLNNQADYVLRSEAAISLPRILGMLDKWAVRGINGDHPLITVYADYTDFYEKYDDITLGYLGLSVSVIGTVDIKKYGYPNELRPDDVLLKREALEYILFCVENENADKDKSIVNRALYEKIIGLSDLISFADLDEPIGRKQYNKILYNLFNHRRYLFLNKENISIQHDLDSYSGTSITYKEYLDSIQSAEREQ